MAEWVDQVIKLRFYVKSEVSEVFNDIGAIEVECKVTDALSPHAAIDAKHTISLDLPTALRKMANQMEGKGF